MWGNKLLLDSSLFSLALHRMRPHDKNLNNNDNDAIEMQGFLLFLQKII